MFDGFRVRRRVDELEEDVRKLKRDMQTLELEWSNALDKLRQMMGRIAKRAEVAEKAAEQSEEQAPLPDTTPGLFLTARQKQLQQQILMRRSRINGGER